MVPVIDQNQKPLMPCSEKRARKMIESRKATPFWKRGVFCVRLNVEPSSRTLQPIAVGIDPGSKREGFTVKSEAHTFLNIQAKAVTHVKERVETRRRARKNRRSRKTPYRQCRFNRRVAPFFVAPSTRARWGWKLRIASWLKKLFPITDFVVEDIKARTIRNARKWNLRFSPIEHGKNWFYEHLATLGRLDLRQGFETHALRIGLELKKSPNKLANVFNAHCVDSWVLANSFVGGHVKPDNERMLLLEPIQFHRRQLHVQLFTKGGHRKPFGGTMSLGLKKGRLAKHAKHGLCYIGGQSKIKGLSIHSTATGARIARRIKPKDLRLLAFNSWRFA